MNASNLLCMVVLLVIITLLAGVPNVIAEENHIKISDNYKKKDGTGKLYEVYGKVSSYNLANMTVTYPDSTVRIPLASIPITNRGDFQTFIALEPTDPAGLYKVEILPYNDTATRSAPLEAYFFLADYDGMVNLYIKRNSVIECGKTPGYCIKPGITHIPSSFGVRFFNNDYNTHQIKVGSDIGNVVLPQGDHVYILHDAGMHEYNCTIHPWIDGMVRITDVPSIRYSDKTVAKPDMPVTFVDANNAQKDTDIQQEMQYDTSDCGTCHVGIITKIIDGDTIHVDKKPVRLALVNTPEKRHAGYEDATRHVQKACPIGSHVLVDVDDMLLSDGRGVNYAKITCSDTHSVNQSLMENGLAKMYDQSCTESEFMYEVWATHDCKKSNTIQGNTTMNILDHDTNNNSNHTTSTNTTALTRDVYDNNNIAVYILIMSIIILTCLLLLWYKRASSQETSFPNTIWLE